MNQSLIAFEHMELDRPKKGAKQKIYTDGHTRLRLLQFDDEFTEEHWFLKGHFGYVLSGEMEIDFSGTILSYKKGDGLWIIKGAEAQHKVIMEKGKQVELILFEYED